MEPLPARPRPLPGEKGDGCAGRLPLCRNAHPSRLDLDDIHAAAAKDHGIPIVISTDAHSVHGFDVLRYGVEQARRAGLTRDDVANTRNLTEFRQMLK